MPADRLLSRIRTLVEAYNILLEVRSVFVRPNSSGTVVDVVVRQDATHPIPELVADEISPDEPYLPGDIHFDARIQALICLLLTHMYLEFSDLFAVNVSDEEGTRLGWHEGVTGAAVIRQCVEFLSRRSTSILDEAYDEDEDDGDLNEAWDALAVRREIAASLPVLPKDALVKAHENTPNQTWIDVLGQE